MKPQQLAVKLYRRLKRSGAIRDGRMLRDTEATRHNDRLEIRRLLAELPLDRSCPIRIERVR